MSLLSRFFFRRPPDGLLEFVDRVYVFDSCFSTEVVPDGMYQMYLHEILTELHEQFPDSAFLAFNFRESEKRSQFAEILCEYDVTVMDYPRQYEGCPLLPLSLIQHFLRVCGSWLLLGNHQNIILLHCERGGWPLLALLLASFLIFRKLHSGERRTLEIVHREAPKGLLQLLSPLNPFPSQLRYLQYVARRNIAPEWPLPERALSLDCVILRAIPNFDAQNGCRPIIRIFGRNLHSKDGPSTRMLFTMSKKMKTLRHYRQADCDVIKIDIQCLVQGDVVLECVHLDLDLEREVMMFRVMFNTAFIRSNILMLNSDNLDILWDSKERYPKGFRAEVLFGEVESLSPPKAPTTILNGEEKGGLPIEAFYRVQELFSGVELVDNSDAAALWLLKQLSVLGDVKKLTTLQGGGSSYTSPVDSEEENNASSAADSLDEAFEVSPKASRDTENFLLSNAADSVISLSENGGPHDVILVSEPLDQVSVETTLSSCRQQSSVPPEEIPTIFPPSPSPPHSIDPTPSLPPPTPLPSPPSFSTIDSSTMFSTTSKQPPPPPPPPPPSFSSMDSLTISSTASQPPPPPPPPLPPSFSSMDSLTISSTASKRSPPPSPPAPPCFSSIDSSTISSTVTKRLPPPSLPPPPSFSRMDFSTISSTANKRPPPPSPPPPPSFSSMDSSTISSTASKRPPPPPRPLPPSFSSVDSSTISSTASKRPPPLPRSLPPSFSSVDSLTISSTASKRPHIRPPPPPPNYSTIDSLTMSSTTNERPPPPSPPPPPSFSSRDFSTMSLTTEWPPTPPLPLPPSFSHIDSSTMSSTSSEGPVPPPPPPPPSFSSKDSSMVPLTTCKGPSPPPPPPSPPLSNSLSPDLPTLPPPPPPPLSVGNTRNKLQPSTHQQMLPPPLPPLPHPPRPTLASSLCSIPVFLPPPSIGCKPVNAHRPPPPPPPPPPPGASSSTVAPPLPPSIGKGKMASGPTSHGRGRSTSGASNAPKKTSLKPLHWVKVARAMQGSLWADSQKQENQPRAPEIDISELESLFSASSDGSGSNKAGGRRCSAINKPEKVQLVDLRRAYNCEIMLTKIKIPLPDMINAVLALDSSALDIDQVENLIKFCPTKDEMETLKNYPGDKEMLGKCEQFFLELMKVPRVESKLRVFSFRITFSTQVDDLRRNLNTINKATREVKESAKLRQIMQTILTLGNALNQGTARGSAVGFKLDSLLKLSDTRARNNKMTLMHYLCKLLAEKMPELLDFREDLGHLEAASKIQLKTLAEEMQAVSKGLEKVEQELTASENDSVVSVGFRKVLKNFLSTAEAEVRSLISLYSEVGRNADSLSQYFGEDPARCPFEQVTQVLFVFVKLFNKSREENERQADAEKKKLEKEAMKEQAAANLCAKKDGK